MDNTALQQLCQSHGFSLELHNISTESYFAILVPLDGEPPKLDSRKAELDDLRRQLIELCPSIKRVSVQIMAD